MEPKASLNLVLLKIKGAEESSSGNALQAQEALKSNKSSKSTTKDVTVDGCRVTFYYPPGLSDTDMSEKEIQQKYKEVLQKCKSRPCVFLLAIQADRFTQEEQETVEKIEKLLGEEQLKKTWILFGNGDQLEERNMTIREFIDESEPLKNLVQKLNQRYHVFKNKTTEPDEAEFKMLILKLIQTSSGLKASEGGMLVRRSPAILNSAPDERHTPVSHLLSRRIVLLGKTGVGKSAAGNTIMGQKEFNSVMSTKSVTRECAEKKATVSSRSVSVVDTPGLIDTKMKPEELMREIARSVYISSPGPHAFLIVFRVNDRFTEHEQQIPQQIEMMFGQEVLKYSIILFTHGDLLEEKPIEELIQENCRLRHLIQECGGRFHVFNNKAQNKREQVNDLLQKIDSMIEQNGGGHYSNQMFEDALRFRQEEEKRRLREEEERKQREEKQIQERIERVRKEEEERVRAEMKADGRLKAERRREEKQIQEELKSLRNQAEERTRAEREAEQKDEPENPPEFEQFYKQYEQRFSFLDKVNRTACAVVEVVSSVARAVADAANKIKSFFW